MSPILIESKTPIIIYLPLILKSLFMAGTNVTIRDAYGKDLEYNDVKSNKILIEDASHIDYVAAEALIGELLGKKLNSKL